MLHSGVHYRSYQRVFLAQMSDGYTATLINVFIFLWKMEKMSTTTALQVILCSAESEENFNFCLTWLKPIGIIHHYRSSRPWEPLWMCFGVWSQEGWQKRSKEIYYNQISLWSKLKEDVKMESRLNMAWVILSRGIWTFRALSVGRDYPPCCFSARSCSEAQWAEHGTSRAVVRG